MGSLHPQTMLNFQWGNPGMRSRDRKSFRQGSFTTLYKRIPMVAQQAGP